MPSLSSSSFEQAKRDPGKGDHALIGLLPALSLARVDGKSPVEYIVEDADRRLVRDVASALLRNPVSRLDAVEGAWSRRVREVLGSL